MCNVAVNCVPSNTHRIYTHWAICGLGAHLVDPPVIAVCFFAVIAGLACLGQACYLPYLIGLPVFNFQTHRYPLWIPRCKHRPFLYKMNARGSTLKWRRNKISLGKFTTLCAKLCGSFGNEDFTPGRNSSKLRTNKMSIQMTSASDCSSNNFRTWKNVKFSTTHPEVENNRVNLFS